MHISGASPMHIARAYQAQQAGQASHVARPVQTQQARPAQPVHSTVAPNSSQPITPPNVAQMSTQVNELIAARVDQPVDFNGAESRAGGPALAMYTRAADRIEAGTSLHIGRSLDLRG